LPLGWPNDQPVPRIAEFGERLRGSILHDESWRIDGISLHDCPLTNEDIRSIARMNGLKRLFLRDLDFSGLDLDPLSSIRSLESLNIANSRIADAQLKFVRSLDTLLDLDISTCELTGEFLLDIPKPGNLRSVTLDKIAALKGPTINRFLAAATALKAFFLESSYVTTEDLTALAQLGRCDLLWLKDNGSLRSDICAYISKMGALKYLTLSGTLVGDAAVAELSRMKGLVSLKLASTPMGDGLGKLEGLDKLKELDLSNTRVGDAGLEGVLRSRNIKTLNLANAHVTDMGVMQLRGLKGLEVLRLSGTSISDRSVDTFAGLRSLVRLDLSRTAVGDGIARIGGHALLAHMHLGDTNVGDAGVQGLSHCAGLATLDLSGTSVGDDGVAHLAKLSLLEELDLARTSIGDPGARALGMCPSLHTLDIGRTRVGDAGVAPLFKVGFLTLSGTKVTPSGILALLGHKEGRPSWIDITGTEIRSVGKIKPVRHGDRTMLIAPFDTTPADSRGKGE
jgi:Leucine-rich repeat (LRR) protein